MLNLIIEFSNNKKQIRKPFVAFLFS